MQRTLPIATVAAAPYLPTVADEDMKRNVIPRGLLLGRNGGVSSANETNYTDPDLEILSYEIPRERESRQKRRTSVGSSRKCRTCYMETFYVSFEGAS